MYKVEKQPCIFEPLKPNSVAPSAVELSGGKKPRLPASNTKITSSVGTGITFPSSQRYGNGGSSTDSHPHPCEKQTRHEAFAGWLGNGKDTGSGERTAGEGTIWKLTW
jgi:hypothetical protein